MAAVAGELGDRRSEIGKNFQLPSTNSHLRIAEILAILHKWGIHTLGQLAALDKEELRARLGNEAVRLWERANGTATRLLKLIQPPEIFEESFEFDHEIETAEPLLFMLRRFLEQLAFRLNAIYLVARELTLRITFSNSGQICYQTDSCRRGNRNESAATGNKCDGHPPSPRYSATGRQPLEKKSKAASPARTYERVFKIPQPTNDVDLLFRMLQTHLENFKSEHPIVAVALTANPIRPVSQQFGLFETALKNPQQLFETLARLTALLGNNRVGTPVLEETHRPDVFRMEPFDWRRNDECRMTNVEGTPKRPALRRFRPPAKTSIFVSEHRHLESEKIRGEIVDQKGPYLLSGNWWDEKAWARAEWDMQLEKGELVRAHETNATWKLDGIYD